jgi:AcrR family transcriptional regulator
MPQSTALPAAPTRRQGASVNLAEPRAARTHEALTSALFDLLRENDLTEISISELCRTAGVHRTTFYGHYADIFAFASDAFARMLDDLASIDAPDADGRTDPADDALPEELAASDPAAASASAPASSSVASSADQSFDPAALTAAYADSVRHELQHVLEHRGAYRMMFNTRVDAGFRRELFQRTLRRASLAIRTWQSHGVCLDLDTTSAAAFIAGGMVGVLEDWANSDDTDIEHRTAEVMAVSPAWCVTRDEPDALR